MPLHLTAYRDHVADRLVIIPRVLDDQTQHTVAVGTFALPANETWADTPRLEYISRADTDITADDHGRPPGMALTDNEARALWALLDKEYGQEARVDRETLTEAVMNAERAEQEAARYATRIDGLEDLVAALRDQVSILGHVADDLKAVYATSIEQVMHRNDLLAPLADNWLALAEQAMSPRIVTLDLAPEKVAQMRLCGDTGRHEPHDWEREGVRVHCPG